MPSCPRGSATPRPGLQRQGGQPRWGECNHGGPRPVGAPARARGSVPSARPRTSPAGPRRLCFPRIDGPRAPRIHPRAAPRSPPRHRAPGLDLHDHPGGLGCGPWSPSRRRPARPMVTDARRTQNRRSEAWPSSARRSSPGATPLLPQNRVCSLAHPCPEQRTDFRAARHRGARQGRTDAHAPTAQGRSSGS